MSPDVRRALSGWFMEKGAYVLVDGQFGSTGKGLIAGVLAEAGQGAITHCTTNAGPNSGHTAYFFPEEHHGEVKVVTQQVPVASVFLRGWGWKVDTLINAGAIIDENILGAEVSQWLGPDNVYVHPNAARISDEAKEADQAIVARVAGTGKGVGPALAAKVNRDPHAVMGSLQHHSYSLPKPRSWDNPWDWTRDTVFVETAQGFSLGYHSQFYPHTTSRECTVMQALADARIPAQMLQKVIASYRTYPIRVGNSPEGGYSGDHYDDQREITFADIGQPEELTTVTKRVRRLFTWSRKQFRDSLAANRPDVIFINFMNYFRDDHERDTFMSLVLLDYHCTLGKAPEAVLVGYGPRTRDVKVWGK